MLSFAYGSSLFDESDDSNVVESLNHESMYIKIINCDREKALLKMVKYHRKCIQFGIDHRIISDYEVPKNKPIEELIKSNINTIFDLFPGTLEIMIISNYINDNTYLKHYLNVSYKNILLNLYMAL